MSCKRVAPFRSLGPLRRAFRHVRRRRASAKSLLPTPARAAAQHLFLTGLAQLHNFEYPDAAEWFKKARGRRSHVRACVLGRSDDLQPSCLDGTGHRVGA